jgi:threonine synthase
MVQSQGSRNLVQNIGKDEFTLTPSTTIADSISVDIPRNFYMAEEFILKYQGDTILVSDREILDASLELGKNYGLFAEPAAVTAYAGMKKWQKLNVNKEEVLILLTGSGLKDIFSIENEIKMPNPIKNLDELT